VHRDVELLLQRAGQYQGHGINHEDQPFHGELEIGPLLGNRGVTLKFRAVGIDGTVYHDERSWVAPDEGGEIAMWSIHSNGEGVLKHTRRNGAGVEGANTLVFGLGDRNDPAVFRIEVALDLWADGAVGYRFAWGQPGGEFKPRSSVRMVPEDAATSPAAQSRRG
jgi:hypothetical protein